jgi:AcrR family transcriptional regulator
MAQPPRRPSRPPAPEPPWWRSRHDDGRRGGLSREAIVEAALQVLNAEGLDGLTMRRLAAELGVGAASLYWHVDGKEALLQLVIDRVVSEIALPEPDPSRWQEQIKQFARDARSVMSRYRDVGRATLGRIPVGPNLMRVNEWALGLLTAAGVPPQAAAWSGDVFGLFLGAHAYETDLEAGGGDADQDPPPPMEAMLMSYMQSLPAETFPSVVANLEHLTSGDPDQRFEFGLDLLVRGLASLTADAAER